MRVDVGKGGGGEGGEGVAGMEDNDTSVNVHR